MNRPNVHSSGLDITPFDATHSKIRTLQQLFSALKRLNLENLLQFPAKGFSIRLKRAPPETRQRGKMI